jgi:hypothetical protein
MWNGTPTIFCRTRLQGQSKTGLEKAGFAWRYITLIDPNRRPYSPKTWLCDCKSRHHSAHIGYRTIFATNNPKLRTPPPFIPTPLIHLSLVPPFFSYEKGDLKTRALLTINYDESKFRVSVSTVPTRVENPPGDNTSLRPL